MVDWSKPIQTRDGRKAEFLRELKTDDPDRFVVIVTTRDGCEAIETYYGNGRYLSSTTDYAFDIINVPEPSPVEEEAETMYAPVLELRSGSRFVSGNVFPTPEDAMQCKDRVIGVTPIQVYQRKK